MKISTIILATLLTLPTLAFANYNKGYKYFKKYIENNHIKSSDFLKEFNITPKNIDKKFNKKIIVKINDLMTELEEENDKKDISKLKKLKKGLIEIFKSKKKTNDVKDFLKGIIEGKVPAKC